jgi:Thioredoxin.
MREKTCYLHLQPWYFIVLLLAFYGITSLISESKLKNIPESVTETSFLKFDGCHSETGCNFIFFYDGKSELCNKMRFSMEQFAEKKKNKQGIHFFEVNIETNPEYYYKYNISGIPNLLIIKNNKELMRIMGVVPDRNLEKAYETVVKL